MRKKLFLELFRKTLLVGFSFFCFGGGAIFAQIGGGGGIIHVTGDPDAILATQDVDINEGNICFDRDAQIVYFFDPTGTAGVNQWNGVAVGSFADTDTRLTNPTVSGGNLVFDILDVITNTTSGTETVAILDIAPVQSVTGVNDISVTSPSAGVYQVDFTEFHTILSFSNDTLFYTDETNTVNSIALPSSDGSDTQVEDAGDISVTGSGTTADPYVVDFTEFHTTLSFSNDTLFYTDETNTVNSIALPTSDGTDTKIDDSNSIYVLGDGSSATPYTLQLDGAHDAPNAGKVPVTDGVGNLSWTDAVTGAVVTSEGAIRLNLTDGTSVILDLDDAPKVSNMAEVNTAISDLTTAGHPSGIVIADEANTFGLPATSQVGVIFFIKQ